MKRSLTLLAAAAVFAAGLVFSLARAADDATAPGADELPGLPGRHARAVARELDLTADQRQALKDIIRMHQPMLRPQMEQARIAREELRAIIAAPTLDEHALAAQADRIAATQKQLVIASAHLRADLRKILNAEQLAKLEDLRAQAARSAHQGREKFREWLLKP